MQLKQSISEGVYTFIRVDGPRRWEESENQTAGLFANRSAEIQKIEEEEEEGGEQKEKEKEPA